MKVKKYVTGGEIRCVQSAFRMVLHALTGEDPGQDAADKMTGYVEGRGTWQFEMLVAFASYDLQVVDHEQLDIAKFRSDPEQAIRDQVEDPAAIQGILDETDFEAELAALKKCVASPNITFIESAPTFDDLKRELLDGRLVMVNVNRSVLRGIEGREGHILILESFDEDGLVVHDPGDDGGLNKRLDKELFEKAWMSPSKHMANYISVWC